MSYEIKLRFRRFGYGAGHPTGPNMYYIELSFPEARGGSVIPRAQDLDNLSFRIEEFWTVSCTIVMDYETIICFMTDGLARRPDTD